MVREVNLARAYPKVYAQIIGQYMHNQAASWSGLEHDDYIAGKELMAMLNSMGPLSILQPKQCVYEAAKMHGLDCEKGDSSTIPAAMAAPLRAKLSKNVRN